MRPAFFVLYPDQGQRIPIRLNSNASDYNLFGLADAEVCLFIVFQKYLR